MCSSDLGGVESMISVRDLWKVYGPRPERIVGSPEADLPRATLESQHGNVVAMREVSLDVAPGEVGEIYLRGPNLSDFTYNNDDAKRREVALGDLVTVGDVGYQDADGYVFLCDRKRDMIISGGVNIYPAEIESVLIQMPGVRDCAVFGIPDEEFGELICAHVEPQPGAMLDATEIGRAHV